MVHEITHPGVEHARCVFETADAFHTFACASFVRVHAYTVYIQCAWRLGLGSLASISRAAKNMKCYMQENRLAPIPFTRKKKSSYNFHGVMTDMAQSFALRSALPEHMQLFDVVHSPMNRVWARTRRIESCDSRSEQTQTSTGTGTCTCTP
jgi:hypothetical protein